MNKPERFPNPDLTDWLPASLREIEDDQKAIPRIAKDAALIRQIEAALPGIPTAHDLWRRDARELDFIPDNNIHLVLTSPPYWTLKTYNASARQMGHIENYDQFLDELDKVWRHCHRVLVPGGRLICVVGDVCLSRRKNAGEHTVVPLQV
jgi:modification methylase